MGWVGRGEAGRVRRLCRPGEGAARGQMVQNMESCMVLNVMAIIPWLKMMTCLDLVAGTCVAGVFSQGLGMIIQSSGDHHVLLLDITLYYHHAFWCKYSHTEMEDFSQ